MIFLALSVLLHFLALWASTLLPEDAVRRKEARAPIPVEILDPPRPGEEKRSIPVAEAPKAEPDNISPAKKPPSVFADKDQSVKKETVPPPAPPSQMAQRARPAMPRIEPSLEEAGEARKAPPLSGSGETEREKSGPSAGTASKEPRSPVDEPIRTGPASPGAQAEPRILQEEQKRPSLFPSDERIAELTRNYEAGTHEKETGKTLQLNTAELKYQKYLLDMKRKIEFYWDYPALAARNGWQGSLFINFTINRDGTVSGVRMERSSGYPMLDDAAITAIRLAAPFPPFPANFTVEDLNIKGQFQYHIVAPRGGG
ncbi:MAG: TonB family protein [Candidatus Methylomirabilis sp.]|nr:TonB family protein [Deltaproteobacteria bacterium]